MIFSGKYRFFPENPNSCEIPPLIIKVHRTAPQTEHSKNPAAGLIPQTTKNVSASSSRKGLERRRLWGRRPFFLIPLLIRHYPEHLYRRRVTRHANQRRSFPVRGEILQHIIVRIAERVEAGLDYIARHTHRAPGVAAVGGLYHDAHHGGGGKL